MITEPNSGWRKIKIAGIAKYTPEKIMCFKLYNSTCLFEKYLAKRSIKATFIGSIGSKENIPILYQDLIPLISGAKNKSPTRNVTQRK